MKLAAAEILIMIAAIALGTAITRFLPFLLFPDRKKAPEFVLFLGKVLPPAVMGLLTVYCLRGVSFLAAPHGVPEIMAVLFVVGLHKWKRNTLFSIAGGTILYMVLIQGVFA